MPRAYIGTSNAPMTFEAVCRKWQHGGDLFDITGSPVDAAGCALSITGLTRDEAEALYRTIGAALQDADAGEAAKFFNNATEQRPDRCARCGNVTVTYGLPGESDPPLCLGCQTSPSVP